MGNPNLIEILFSILVLFFLCSLGYEVIYFKGPILVVGPLLWIWTVVAIFIYTFSKKPNQDVDRRKTSDLEGILTYFFKTKEGSNFIASLGFLTFKLTLFTYICLGSLIYKGLWEFFPDHMESIKVRENYSYQAEVSFYCFFVSLLISFLNTSTLLISEGKSETDEGYKKDGTNS